MLCPVRDLPARLWEEWELFPIACCITNSIQVPLLTLAIALQSDCLELVDGLQPEKWTRLLEWAKLL